MDLWCLKIICFVLGFFPQDWKGQKADAMWLALLGCCCWEESGRWQEWRREQNVINQQQEHQRSKGLKAAVKITCCLTQGHNSPNRICSCSPSCSQSGRAAGCRSGLNWTVILRKTSVHASPSDTSTQPCPEAQLHTRMWSSEMVEFCLSHQCTQKCGQQDWWRIPPQTLALLLPSQTQQKLLLSYSLIDKSATEVSNTWDWTNHPVYCLILHVKGLLQKVKQHWLDRLKHVCNTLKYSPLQVGMASFCYLYSSPSRLWLLFLNNSELIKNRLQPQRSQLR